MTDRTKKRTIIFSIFLLLSATLFISENLYVKISIVLLQTTYVAMLVFRKDIANEKIETDIPDTNEHFTDSNFSDTTEKILNVEKQLTDDFESSFEITSELKEVKTDSTTFIKSKGAIISESKDRNQISEKYAEITKEVFPIVSNEHDLFGFVIHKLLAVLREMFFGNSALFFFYNKQQNKLSLFKYDSQSDMISDKKFNVEEDILSRIVMNKEPELLTNILPNAEEDIIVYYEKPSGIKSFIGVPLFHKEELTGILALDSKEPDAFGPDNFYTLGRITRIISILITLFGEKHKETKSEKRLNALLNVLDLDRKFENIEELHLIIERTFKSFIEWDAFTFVLYDHNSKNYYTSKVVKTTNLKYIGDNLRISLQDSLVGKAIKTNRVVEIQDMSNEKMKRYSSVEDVEYSGSFLAIPLGYDNVVYGVLCFDHLKKNFYNKYDVLFLKNSVRIFAFIIYSFSKQSFLKENIMLDIPTGLLIKDAFEFKVKEELNKLFDLKLEGVISLIEIDEIEGESSLFDENLVHKAVVNLSEVIKENLSYFSFSGRVNERTFAVFFFNKNIKDVLVWAEKIKKKIANVPFSSSGKQTTATVSIGLASNFKGGNYQEIYLNADLALKKAKEQGGNTVKEY